MNTTLDIGVTAFPGQTTDNPPGNRPGQQYRQRVDESRMVCMPQIVPGLRGKARTLPHFADPLATGPIGPVREINGGYPFSYVPVRVRSYVPATSTIQLTLNGKSFRQVRFKAVATQEFGSTPVVF